MSVLTRKEPVFHASKKSAFTHTLVNHPLMQYEELKKLALRHPTVKFYNANIPRTQNLETVVKDYPCQTDLQGAMDNIQTSGSYVFIQNVQNDPLYGKLVEEVLSQLKVDIHRTHKNMRNVHSWVFISSPGGISPYHRDQESTHLFHIKGKKRFWLWSPHDRDIVTQEENEYLHGVYGLSKTVFREEFRPKGELYNLGPGDGLYFPYTSPHMVENENEEFSISFSITHMTDEDYAIRRINKINQIMRKLGLRPMDYGISGLVDELKLKLHWCLRTFLGPFDKNWKNA